MKGKASVSVVVPAYNAEKTIERCVESLLNQTIPVEIIIIDDGSTDNTEEVVRRFANIHPNVIYKRQENSGVSSARNSGLFSASCDYIGFVDSDDYVRRDMFEQMIKPLEEDKSLVISICYLDRVDADNASVKKGNRGITIDILCSSNVRGYPWNKVFRRSIIEKSRLSFSTSIHVMEDKLFCLEYMSKTSGGGILINDQLYYYDKHDDVRVLDRYRLERYKTGFDACEKILELTNIREDTELYLIQQAITVKHCVQISRECVRTGEPFQRYKDYSKHLGKLVLCSRHLSLKQKIGWIILQSFPQLLKVV